MNNPKIFSVNIVTSKYFCNNISFQKISLPPQLPHFTYSLYIDLDISSKYPMHVCMQIVLMLKYDDSNTFKNLFLHFYNFSTIYGQNVKNL
jgi:hypothetical protein